MSRKPPRWVTIRVPLGEFDRSGYDTVHTDVSLKHEYAETARQIIAGLDEIDARLLYVRGPYESERGAKVRTGNRGDFFRWLLEQIHLAAQESVNDPEQLDAEEKPEEQHGPPVSDDPGETSRASGAPAPTEEDKADRRKTNARRDRGPRQPGGGGKKAKAA